MRALDDGWLFSLFEALLGRIICVPLVALVLTSLLAALLVDGSPLLDARIVRFKLEASVRREVENLLHGLATVTVTR